MRTVVLVFVVIKWRISTKVCQSVWFVSSKWVFPSNEDVGWTHPFVQIYIRPILLVAPVILSYHIMMIFKDPLKTKLKNVVISKERMFTGKISSEGGCLWCRATHRIHHGARHRRDQVVCWHSVRVEFSKEPPLPENNRGDIVPQQGPPKGLPISSIKAYHSISTDRVCERRRLFSQTVNIRFFSFAVSLRRAATCQKQCLSRQLKLIIFIKPTQYYWPLLLCHLFPCSPFNCPNGLNV